MASGGTEVWLRRGGGGAVAGGGAEVGLRRGGGVMAGGGAGGGTMQRWREGEFLFVASPAQFSGATTSR